VVNLGELCEYWAVWRPQAPAIRTRETITTWSELEDRTARIAGGLNALGTGHGDRIGIYAANSLAWCELAIAALRIGAIVVPLNLRFTSCELLPVVNDAQLSCIAYDSARAERYASLAADRPDIVPISLDNAAPAELSLDTLAASARAGTPGRVAADDVAIISFTSGTTGKPKGAMLTHANILAHVTQWSRANDWTTSTALLCCLPLAFTGGIVNNFLGAYGVGGTLVLEEAFEPARALELITSVPVTAMTGVPVMFEQIASAPGFAEADLSHLSTAITGGATVSEALLRAYQAKGVMIRQAYALTEASGSVCILPRELAIQRPDSAGLPNVHTAVRIADDHGLELPAGEIGEIQVKGPQVCVAYWRDPEATAAARVGGWLRTGDIGYLGHDGLLQVVDRKNDKIISGGLNLYPAEIEKVIAGYPGVAEIAAFGVPHERWGETVAVVVGGNGVEFDGLLSYCRTVLADYKRPRYIQIRSEPLPRSPNGKILRRTLREEFDAAEYMRTSST
jgi:fatty-acyl-CoA synthase